MNQTIIHRSKRICLGLLVLLPMTFLFCNGCADRLFYYPTRALHSSRQDYRAAYEDVYFKNPRGDRLHGVMRKPLPPGSLKPARDVAGTVVHVHGNAGNVSAHLPLSHFLLQHNFQVFIFDYRGYGESQGRVTRAGTLEDVHAAIDYVKSRPDVDPGRVLLFGQSLGAALALVAAAQRDDLCGVYAEAPFTSYYAIARVALARTIILLPLAPLLPPLFLSPGLAPIDYVDQIRAPLLILHGESDSIVPAWMSKRLYARAREPKKLILLDKMDHLHGEQAHGENYVRPIVDFYRQCLNSATRAGDEPTTAVR